MSAGDDRRLGVAVIGAGAIGRVHATKLAHVVPSARLVAVADRDVAAASELAEPLGAGAVDLDALLADPAVQAVVVATPPDSHVALVERAAAAGKHVLCEKPLAYTSEEARRAVRAAHDAGVTLQVGFHRRFDRHYAAATARIAAGDVGEVKLFFASHRDMAVGDANSHERVIYDNLCHDFDAARWMVGEIVEVTAIGSEHPDPADPDDVIVALRFANGAVGTLDGSRAAGYGFECRTEVVGGSASVRVATRPPVEIEWLEPGRAMGTPPADFLERFEDAYAIELEDFTRGVLDGRPPTVTGEDGVAAAVLAECADQSLRERRPVAVPQPVPIA